MFDIGIDAPLGVVDRHHIVAPDLEGKRGTIQIVFLLSTIVLQPSGAERRALVPEPGMHGRVSTAPDAYGAVLMVPTWEEQRGTLKIRITLHRVFAGCWRWNRGRAYRHDRR